jgi:hypothetical protein
MSQATWRRPLAVLATKIHDIAATAGWHDAPGPGQCLLAAQNGVGRRERLAPPTRAAVVPGTVGLVEQEHAVQLFLRGCARITGPPWGRTGAMLA